MYKNKKETRNQQNIKAAQFNLKMTKSDISTTTDKYEAYFIPANVNKSFKTREFENNFSHDENITFADQQLTANYVTGKKLLSQSLIPPNSKLTACVTQQQNSETASNSIKPIKMISKLHLAEREGNEFVLIDEINKFKEFLDINSIIHT